jgi:hypothetical protein
VLESVVLNLLIGPAVPVPAPREAIEALESAEVNVSARGPGGFQLTFRAPPRSPLVTGLLLAGGGLPPLLRAVVALTIGGRVEVLIDGVVTNHQFSTGSRGAPGTLTLTGSDLTAAMDWVRFDGMPYPAMPVEARVALILAKYAALGVVPVIVPRVLADVPNPLNRIPRHQGTDLKYLSSLAASAGYTFYLEPGAVPGSSLAYWGPERKLGAPQASLNVDMDVHTNVESLSFRFNNEARTQYVVMVQEPLTKLPIPIPIPDVSLVNPPLGLVPPLPKRFEVLESANLDPIEAALRGLGKQARSAEAVTAGGSLDVLRYGRVLRPRRVVGVRGAGDAFDGLYFVESVNSTIRPGEFKQGFQLSRNGLVSTVPRVPAATG